MPESGLVESPMTAVLLLGDIPSAGLLANAQAERVPLAKDASAGSPDADAFVEFARQLLEDRGTILALYPSWRGVTAVRFLRLARGALGTDRIGALGLSLPPLALSLVADQMTHMSKYVPAGLLASLTTRVASEIYAGAWVRSVTKLERIETSMGAHLASYLPGAGFMVSAAPRHGVHRITKTRPVANLEQLPSVPLYVLASRAEGGNLPWFDRQFRGLIRPVAVTMTPPQPLSAEFWGTKKYVEFVVFSGDPQALPQVARSTRYWLCAWCRQPTSLSECPFCGMAQGMAQGGSPNEPSPAAWRAADVPGRRWRHRRLRQRPQLRQ